jgi:hypothetical protein
VDLAVGPSVLQASITTPFFYFLRGNENRALWAAAWSRAQTPGIVDAVLTSSA